jgi:hypothetical protein
MFVGSPTRTYRRRTPTASSSTFPALCSSSISQFLCAVVVLADCWLIGGGRGDPELNDYVGSAGTAVTIAQRVIFRAGSVYT